MSTIIPKNDTVNRPKFPPDEGISSIQLRDIEFDNDKKHLRIYRQKFCFLVIPCGVVHHHEKRIVGGNETTPYAMPWTVALLYPNGNTLCSGVLISSWNILTAAHCTNQLGFEQPFSIVIGEHYLRNATNGSMHFPSSVIPHPDYVDGSYSGDDIAIVTLSEQIQLGSRAVHVCLPSPNINDTFLSGKSLTVSGWGRTSTSASTSDVLRSVEIPYVNITTCQSIEINSWTNITENMICTGDLQNGGVSTCHGDSGGEFYNNK